LEKEVIWTAQARDDLQKIYEFNSLILGEEKAYSLIEGLAGKVDILYQRISGGTRYISDINPEMNYQKLIYGYYLIFYREDGNRVYINKIFDARQNPEKLTL
jgi:plasmid stabilization system protein ParE